MFLVKIFSFSELSTISQLEKGIENYLNNLSKPPKIKDVQIIIIEHTPFNVWVIVEVKDK